MHRRPQQLRGRIGIGRLHSGTIHEKDLVLVVPSEGRAVQCQIRKVYTFENLGKVEVPELMRATSLLLSALRLPTSEM